MKYISIQHLKQLKKELEELKLKRQEISKRIQEAKTLGDLSENAEYQEAKEAQAFNEGRLAQIESIIKEAVIIKEEKRTKVEVGARITVSIDNGNFSQKKEFLIVDPEEVNPAEGKISLNSALGAAFNNKKIGDTIEIQTPQGLVKYKILKIE